MNTPLVDITTNRIDLTLEIRSADGTSTEYYQADEQRIRKTLSLLSPQHLLTQPQLVLASDHSVNVVPVRGIDMILARSSTPSPPVLPLIFPAGLLDITEVGEDVPDDDSGGKNYAPIPLVSHVEVHTLGGWVVTLKILVATGGTLLDQRQWFAHFMNQPVVTFRLRGGGIGLINPNNVTRVSARPALDALPNTALPMELLRWTPPWRCKPTLAARSDEAE